MNPTHRQDTNGPEPHRGLSGAAADLVGLLTSPARFRAWIARSVPPTTPDIAAMTQHEYFHWVNGLDLAECTCFVCSNCGRALPDADVWDEPLCSSCVLAFPDDDRDGYSLTDAGHQALAQADLATATEPVMHDAVRGWCERCGQVLPWVCTWAEPLCSDCVTVIPTPEPGTVDAPQVLRDAALYLERYGWIQGAYYDATATVFTPAADMVGAIGMVCYGGPVEAPAQHFADPGFLDFEAAVLHLDRYLLAEDGSVSYEFNDARGRRFDDVLRVLRDAASRTADELIDAIKAIDALNANMAAVAAALVPTGAFGETGHDPQSQDGPADTADCQHCGAPGGYPYCKNAPDGQLSCATFVEAVQAYSALAGERVCPSCGSNWPGCHNVVEDASGGFADCDDRWHDSAAKYFGGGR